MKEDKEKANRKRRKSANIPSYSKQFGGISNREALLPTNFRFIYK